MESSAGACTQPRPNIPPRSAVLSRTAEYDPEDTLRFYALRLNELGLIKSSPNALIAEGTDWRFLNEIKRELKT